MDFKELEEKKKASLIRGLEYDRAYLELRKDYAPEDDEIDDIIDDCAVGSAMYCIAHDIDAFLGEDCCIKHRQDLVARTIRVMERSDDMQ